MLYQKLKSKAESIVTAYQSDFLIHDKNEMDKDSITPFIYFIRTSGTHLIRFQFSLFFAQQIMDGTYKTENALIKSILDIFPNKAFYYFDGSDLKDISKDQVMIIFEEFYQRFKAGLSDNMVFKFDDGILNHMRETNISRYLIDHPYNRLTMNKGKVPYLWSTESNKMRTLEVEHLSQFNTFLK